jgi:hypothetical protein
VLLLLAGEQFILNVGQTIQLIDLQAAVKADEL